MFEAKKTRENGIFRVQLTQPKSLLGNPIFPIRSQRLLTLHHATALITLGLLAGCNMGKIGLDLDADNYEHEGHAHIYEVDESVDDTDTQLDDTEDDDWGDDDKDEDSNSNNFIWLRDIWIGQRHFQIPGECEATLSETGSEIWDTKS